MKLCALFPGFVGKRGEAEWKPDASARDDAATSVLARLRVGLPGVFRQSLAFFAMVQILAPAFAQEAPSAALKERDELLAKADASVRTAVKDDPARPIYHVLPPANWMNDPNGPIYHAGYYHLFYQHNPYGDQWGNMHWGHVRSRDLV